MRMGPLLDIAANSQEELKEWMFKIREVAMTSEAKVKPASYRWQVLVSAQSEGFSQWSCSHTYKLLREEMCSRLPLLAVNCVNTS